MDKLTVTGLVVREAAMRDNDKLLTLLTAEHGKMTVTGKGVRSLKNKNMVTSQLFCYASYVLTKNKSGYYYISDSDLIESFFGLRGDLLRLSLATYICEVADHISVEENDERPLLRLVLNILYAAAKEKRPLPQIKGAFELRCAVISGFMPDLSGCSVCGDSTLPSYYLDILNGEIVCPGCISKRGRDIYAGEGGGEWTRPFISASPQLLDAMRYTIEADISRLLSFSLPGVLQEQYAAACERYLLHHIGRGFNTLDYYKNFQRIDKR